MDRFHVYLQTVWIIKSFITALANQNVLHMMCLVGLTVHKYLLADFTAVLI